MKNYDVDIYISKLKTFFNENPGELKNLIGNSSSEDFFNEIYRISLLNLQNGDDVEVTEKQMLDILEKINSTNIIEINANVIDSSFGKIFLN